MLRRAATAHVMAALLLLVATAHADVKMPAHDMLLRGAELHRGGDLAGATDAYRRVLAVVPDHPDALQLLGIAHLAQSGAMEDGDGGRGGTAGGNTNGVAARERERHLDEAERLVRAAIVARPDSSQFHSNLGELLRRRGLLEEALSVHGRALALARAAPGGPGDEGTLRYNLGLVAHALGRTDEAVAWYGGNAGHRDRAHRACWTLPRLPAGERGGSG